MSVEQTPVVPAQPAAAPAPTTPTTQSAVDAAIVSGNTGDYRAARRAERSGKPLPEVPVKVEAAASTTVEKPAAETPVEGDPVAHAQPEAPKKIRVTQDYINERIRSAVDEALKAERARISPAQPAAPEKPTEPEEPQWKRIAKMEGAPKLQDFESVEEHAAAMALFVNEKLEAERAERSHGQQLAAEETRRIESFDQRVNEVAKTDPDIVSKIAPLAQSLGKAGGPYRTIGQFALDSERGPELLRHLQENPAELKRLATLPASMRNLPMQAAVRAHTQFIVKEIGKLEAKFDTPSPAPAEPAEPKTLTDAPAPPQTLGTRPAAAADPRALAIRSGDTRAYRELRRKERLAGKR